MTDPDVIDLAAGLAPGDALHRTRRFRSKVVEATQASHDALLTLPVPGLSPADRLHVAAAVCDAAAAPELAQHYRRQYGQHYDQRLQAMAAAPDAAVAVRAAMLQFAITLTTEPRHGDRAALAALKAAGLNDAAIVALAQLVAFLAYQTRVVAGLRAVRLANAMDAGAVVGAGSDAAVGGGEEPAATGAVLRPSNANSTAATAPAPLIHSRGFTNESLDWQSWLNPVKAAEADALQLEVLDESHAQARSSDYYLTLVHQPLMLRHRSAAYNAIMYAPGGAPRAERELGAMVVSVTNGCVYCTSVHAQRYVQLARRFDTVQQVFDNPATAGSTERERAICRFAQAITLRPQALSTEDIHALRAVAMDDAAIIDLLHATAIFGWANRLMHNLGQPVPPKTLGSGL
jgi:uncharacterized peroxidase-related enzyme